VSKTLVGEVMTVPVVTAGETMPFRDLVALLHASDIGAVPVVSPAGRVLGVVSRCDLIAKPADLPAAGWPGSGPRRRDRRRAGARTAAQLMTAPAVTIAPEAAAGQAARLMCRRRVGRLPVISGPDGWLAGIVTRSDLLHVYLRPGGQIRAEIEAAVLPRTSGARPGSLAVDVRDGIVSVSGRVERWSAIAALVRSIQEVKGVVGVDQDVSYDIDDQYPGMLASF
jgi:CBS domain-containing protein